MAFQAVINAAIIEVSIHLNETNCTANEILMEGNKMNCPILSLHEFIHLIYLT